MIQRLNTLIDWFSDFVAHRKGLLPLLGMLLIGVNFIIQLLPHGWLAQTNCLLHVGLMLAIFGLMAARAL
jgi:hypothetical protein